MMKKMSLKLVLFCLCLWRLDGGFVAQGLRLISGNEGDSVTLFSNLAEMKDNDVIQWMFRSGKEHILIAEINVRADSITVYDDVLDGRFRNRLKLDNQTGSLTITNITTEHAGQYELLTNNVRNRFSLTVYDEILMKEGDSVTINSDLTEIMDDEIRWRFRSENTLLAEINKQTNSMTVYDDVLDGRFRDRLKLDDQTGSLTITNITTQHAGAYELQIKNEKKRFLLAVYDEILMKEGDSVTLNSDLTEMKDDDQIQWRFGNENTLLAEINKQTNSMTVYDDVPDERFRDRLKLNNQTGSLTITNTTTQHTGAYQLDLNHEKKSFLLAVYDEILMKEGDSITINSGLTEIMDDEIQWRFRSENTLIAEINKRVGNMTVYDDVLDGRFRNRLKLNNQTGSLTITNITTEHTGVYQLDLSNEIKSFLLAVYDETSVKEGDTLTLNSGRTEITTDEKFLWLYMNEIALIARTNQWDDNITVYDDVLDGRFRDRLKLDDQTGSLTITNITTQHAGRYLLMIERRPIIQLLKALSVSVYGE
ncbi:uncharacterized protein LOC132159484 [Carassius carassius]|uniref:uncharacterized protein LOC132159484 n=1 Tax=Carassius carassius TaxID=217509 RepID=UPI0028689C23|nr:uncharacterized protein LOC132159484 [Carassius carassius]